MKLTSVGSCLKMKQIQLFVVCLWSSVSIFLSSMVVDSKINRDLTKRSAYFQAFQGHVLQNHVIATHQVTLALDCGKECLENSACLSYNYKPTSKGQSECQLNDANKVTCPECYVVDSDVIYYQDAQINNCTGRDGQLSNYDLYFPKKSLTDFVSQTWSIDMNMFTISFWMQTTDSGKGVPFSYAISSQLNELTIFKNHLTIHGLNSDTSLGNYYDGKRHHVCASWENTAGSWNMTLNGTLINSGSGIEVGYTIPGKGYLAIGQEQDVALGNPSGFVLSQSFIGSISGLNVWNKLLPRDEILRMSKACDMGSGDVLKWSDFFISRHGNVIVKCPSTCKM